VANALWRMIVSHRGISFKNIPVDVSDCNDATVPYSTLRFAKLPSDPHDLIPNAYFLDHRHRLPRSIPWERKHNTVYFRGALTGTIHSQENARVAACRVARNIPKSDCKLTTFTQSSAHLRQELEQEQIVCKRDRVNALNGHRYLLDIDGNTSSWHRFWLIGMFCCVPIRFETQWQECWHNVMHEGDHFISATRNDLSEVVEYLRSHEEKSKKIADGAAKLARGLLSAVGVQQMFENVWLQRIDFTA
jgi:hypothetical protein